MVKMEPSCVFLLGIVLTLSGGVDMKSYFCDWPDVACGDDCCKVNQRCDAINAKPVCLDNCEELRCSVDHKCCNDHGQYCCKNSDVCTLGKCVFDFSNIGSGLTDEFDTAGNGNSYRYNDNDDRAKDNNYGSDSYDSSSSSGSYGTVAGGGSAGGVGFILVCCVCVRRRRRIITTTSRGTTIATRSTGGGGRLVLVGRGAGMGNTGRLVAVRGSGAGRTTATGRPTVFRRILTVVTVTCRSNPSAQDPERAAHTGQPSSVVQPPPYSEAAERPEQPPSYSETVAGGRCDDPEQTPPFSDFTVESDRKQLCDETE